MKFIILVTTWWLTCGLSLKLPQVSEKNCLEKNQYQDCYHASYVYQISKMKKEEIRFALRGCELELNRICDESEAINQKNKFIKQTNQAKIDKEAKEIKENPNRGVPKDILDKERACLTSQSKQVCSVAGAYFRYLSSPLNIKRAVKIYKHGCKMKDQSSCDALSLEKKGINRVYDVEINLKPTHYPDGKPPR